MVRCGKSEYHNAGDSEGNAIMLWDRLNGNTPAEDPLTQYPERPVKQNKPWAPWPEVPPYRNIWGSDADGLPYYRRDWQVTSPPPSDTKWIGALTPPHPNTNDRSDSPSAPMSSTTTLGTRNRAQSAHPGDTHARGTCGTVYPWRSLSFEGPIYSLTHPPTHVCACMQSGQWSRRHQGRVVDDADPPRCRDPSGLHVALIGRRPRVRAPLCHEA